MGVELARKYARFTAARLARQESPNATVICGDALALFRGHLADQSLEGVHVYFPDPWWKKRHRKRRVMCAEFLRDVQRVLRPAGRLHFWTDVEEYFRESLEIIAEATSLAGPHDVLEAEPAHDLDYRTHFERRTRLSDQPVFRAEFSREV